MSMESIWENTKGSKISTSSILSIELNLVNLLDFMSENSNYASLSNLVMSFQKVCIVITDLIVK